MKVQNIERRTKDVESFREKIARSAKSYAQPLNEVTDLAGIRVIVYQLEDITKVGEILYAEFDVDRDRSVDKGEELEPERFGYRSVHYIVKINDIRSKLAEWQAYSNMTCEIQVRTVLQHAWAAMSHTLQYKSEVSAPRELRRMLSRLAGLMEIADQEFQTLRSRSLEYAKDITKRQLAGEHFVEASAVTLPTFISSSSSVKRLAGDAKKSGFSFEAWENDETISEVTSLMRTLDRANIRNLSRLEEVIEKSSPWRSAYFRGLLADGSRWEVDPTFVIQLVVIGAFFEQFSLDWLLEEDWHHDMASDLLLQAKSHRK